MTRSDRLKPGTIVTYPYLWKWQADQHETEGRKDRPTCVIATLVHQQDELTHLVLLAISSQPPRSDQRAFEIPEIECRRAGLSDWKRAWVTISEYNYDIAEQSYYLDPNQQPLGRFSKPFVQRLASAALPLFKRGGARVDRTK
ncbi:hypothetical protein L598_008500000030 [Mesorhizobium sp. J18]|uniref:hypothetical protein n=1 Tax=Mesorhizobium sp. J18 TaxID=935263 RepID=UPI00119B6407|nr:hypothetical protein [Mesorhizobium sp. J18]TWG89376.1 hypothetical protein L598_008500000030 [Mesorhizobium sp. J18]